MHIITKTYSCVYAQSGWMESLVFQLQQAVAGQHRDCQMCYLQVYVCEWLFVTKQCSHLGKVDLFRAFSTSMSSLL